MNKAKLCAFGLANLLICTGIFVWLLVATEATTPSAIILLSCMVCTCAVLIATYKAGDKLLAAVSGLVITSASGLAWYCVPVPAMGLLSLVSALITFAIVCIVISSPTSKSHL